MLSLLNRYQLLRDEFLMRYNQNKIPQDIFLKFLEMEEGLIKVCGASKELSEENKPLVNNDTALFVVRSIINHPDKKKKSSLESMISFFSEYVRPFRD